MDLFSKSDPYLIVKIGDKTLNVRILLYVIVYVRVFWRLRQSTIQQENLSCDWTARRCYIIGRSMGLRRCDGWWLYRLSTSRFIKPRILPIKQRNLQQPNLNPQTNGKRIPHPPRLNPFLDGSRPTPKALLISLVLNRQSIRQLILSTYRNLELFINPLKQHLRHDRFIRHMYIQQLNTKYRHTHSCIHRVR